MAGYGKVPLDVGPPPPGPVRTADSVLDRALALHVVVAVAGGLDGGAGLRWAHALGVRLLDDEREYLEDAAEDLRVEDAARATDVESLAVLLWAVGAGPAPPIDDVAPGSPSVLAGAGGGGGRAEAVPGSAVLPGPGEPVDLAPSLRPAAELDAYHDLLAGMAWALRIDEELEVGQSPGAVDPYVVRARLRAAAWVLGADW